MASEKQVEANRANAQKSTGPKTKAGKDDGEDREEEKDEETADWEASVRFGRALIYDACRSDALGRLARHEATLMNALTKTLLLFEANRTTQCEPVMLEA